MMKKLETICRSALAMLLMMCAFAVAVKSQSSPPPTQEQEFLDSIRKGNATRVGELLKQNPNLIKATTGNGTTAVLAAVYSGHDEIAELLLATGIEPNIFEAAATGRLDRVRVLLDKNPELVKAYSPDGWTVLHLGFGSVDLVKLLLDRGADINAVSKNRLTATPLQGTAKFKTIDSARLLIERGANVNGRGEQGRTPLHEVAANGQIEFARLLLDHGADINAKDGNGKTPLTIALENKQTEMATFLRGRNGSQ